MIVISEPSQITDADIRQLVEQRWTELHSPVGSMFVVEVGDSVDELEALTGCPIASNLFEDARFGSEDFVPSLKTTAVSTRWCSSWETKVALSC
jgi:hypothetical protein